MATESRPLAVHRVLFAQGLAGLHKPALELALSLAARHHAELTNLIVEDLELLRAAALPAATEILRHSGEHRPLQADAWAGCARAQAESLRRELARHQGLKWSLRIVQGEYPALAAHGLVRDELLVLARPSPSAWPSDQQRDPVLLIYADAIDKVRLELLASELLHHSHGPPRQLDILPRPDAALLRQALRRHKPGLIIASADAQLLSPPVLRQLIEEADCPVVLQA